MVEYDPKSQKTTSTNSARHKKEKSLGRKLSKKEHVDHKDNNKHNESSSNLKVMSAKKNIGKGNKNRQVAMNANDRCDRCTAAAKVRAVMLNGELLFCGHHAKEHAMKIKEVSIRIDDPEFVLHPSLVTT